MRAQRLVAFGVAALARRIDDASEIARTTGSSTGKAKDTIATGKVLGESAPLADALKARRGGKRFRTEFDHVEPHVARDPASHRNLKARCYGYHQLKTERDRKSGRLKPPEP